MKNYTILLFILAITLTAGEEFQLNSIITEEMWMEGFTASVKISSNIPGVKAENFTIYSDDEGNKRTETTDEITLYITDEDGSENVYTFNKLTKTYTVISADDLPEGKEKPADLDEEESVELVGSETIAGVKCDKYKIDPRGQKIKGDSFLFIDPANKILMGSEIRSGENFKRLEYSGMEFEADKELFKPLEGYKQTDK